jgi:hypothetical protein
MTSVEIIRAQVRKLIDTIKEARGCDDYICSECRCDCDHITVSHCNELMRLIRYEKRLSKTKRI